MSWYVRVIGKDHEAVKQKVCNVLGLPNCAPTDFVAFVERVIEGTTPLADGALEVESSGHVGPDGGNVTVKIARLAPFNLA